MKTKLKWRLSAMPTTESVTSLLNAGVITKEEARDILFTSETKEDRDKESLKSEIKFLRELADKLAKGNRSSVVETIRYIEKPYHQWGWYKPYDVWCNSTSMTVGSGTTAFSAGSGTLTSTSVNTVTPLSAVNTF